MFFSWAQVIPGSKRVAGRHAHSYEHPPCCPSVPASHPISNRRVTGRASTHWFYDAEVVAICWRNKFLWDLARGGRPHRLRPLGYQNRTVRSDGELPNVGNKKRLPAAFPILPRFAAGTSLVWNAAPQTPVPSRCLSVFPFAPSSPASVANGLTAKGMQKIRVPPPPQPTHAFPFFLCRCRRR